MKPKEIPHIPGKVAIAVAFGLLACIRPIKHLQTECLLSSEWEIILNPDMASQQGDPGMGSGEPYLIKIEHAENSWETVEHSMYAKTNGTEDSNVSTKLFSMSCSFPFYKVPSEYGYSSKIFYLSILKNYFQKL